MQIVRYKGLAIGIQHPALWVQGGEQIVRDLVDVLTHERISTSCLRNLVNSRDRLVTGHYELPDGRGCLMFLLTEPLGDAQIRSREDLTRFFGRERGRPGRPGYVAARDSAEYQPAKWLVRLIDGQICTNVRLRYARACELFDYDLVLAVAKQVLAQREALDMPVVAPVVVVA
jgi:hypothetical protein